MLLPVTGMLDVQVAERAMIPPATPGNFHREASIVMVILLNIR